jgi:hypothetical protein
MQYNLTEEEMILEFGDWEIEEPEIWEGLTKNHFPVKNGLQVSTAQISQFRDFPISLPNCSFTLNFAPAFINL